MANNAWYGDTCQLLSLQLQGYCVLQGIQCLDCKQFYEAVETWGDHAPLPICGHVLQGEQLVYPDLLQQN